MKIKMLQLFFLVGSVLSISCSNDDKAGLIIPPGDTLQLQKIEDILNGNNQSLIELLNKVRGSVGKRGPASKTIWSRKNDHSLGLYISANHVYNINGWSSRSAEFFDIASINMGIFETSQIVPINGRVELGNTLIADFPLMHFDISQSATNTTILPSEDFYLGIIDNQRVEQGPFPQYPSVVQVNTPLEIYDPNGRSLASQTWSTPIVGEKALVVGYPQDRVNYPNGAVAYGKILSNLQAESMITQLQSAGDTEGNIPYNPNVEFLIEARALPGMSGGGVFNSEGQLLGIMVRASNTENAPKIIRVVRIEYVKSKITEFYNSLIQSNKDKLKPFIDGEI
ncbi:S1 family peptidase [Aequorivita antarctica]|uniref:Trypsin-like peptidase domain-containing protein n=1 Tax=Aequorivita antarctica TaxID=153266 RepID=A0A5C6Z1R5_9FLAO|nr:serine protease [Aequorivita antarctica]TXD73278.1 trypsin-like peptidase domain-containing protein [Aequorivita antarctica]SRX76031.1 hypothetical protein AEQU3_03029 [Aequorivita antarctica]